jgi:hypothetical protein
MVKDSSRHAAALLDSAGGGTARQDDVRLVRVFLCEGPFELRVPRKGVNAKNRPPQDHIEGFNADATPC